MAAEEPPPPATAPFIFRGVALADFDGDVYGSEYSSLRAGDSVEVHAVVGTDVCSYSVEGWAYGMVNNSSGLGWFPRDYVKTVTPSEETVPPAGGPARYDLSTPRGAHSSGTGPDAAGAEEAPWGYWGELTAPEAHTAAPGGSGGAVAPSGHSGVAPRVYPRDVPHAVALSVTRHYLPSLVGDWTDQRNLHYSVQLDEATALDSDGSALATSCTVRHTLPNGQVRTVPGLIQINRSGEIRWGQSHILCIDGADGALFWKPDLVGSALATPIVWKRSEAISV